MKIKEKYFKKVLDKQKETGYNEVTNKEKQLK